MSLFPGNVREVDDRFVLDDTAVANSMAKAMEEELESLYAQLKETAMPAQSREERRLLFVAIARGMLRYLRDHQEAVETDTQGASGHEHHHDVIFDVTMGSHTSH